MDYEFDTSFANDGGFDVDSMIADVDVDFEDDALTLPDDAMFEDDDDY